ncbi:LacI family DNA-binding transcriptional regulator [Paradevosia shaoguanensis]|uniref:LacI family transcriptional regulator n=1 Tax=Paradevosia shaoguanensis TaxID=1335043 RepID=A0AA41QRB0_9HYPH|nr:LacI family DNA-binding transcriptional regulator [Paradevosia shaoguanensis]MCF1743713.1 LacI family transcriptional regulator [Paradevosia shaoguanensis]MCI0128196.1 LacI family transcriptional regulator [Paradevosia shaoguanensis]QMV00989.1 LacI family DNA-binding transcriptional regulator [Devosia sp. D6-9]CDP51119.1 Transcriptional regulator of rhamnose utilization, LacI family [Devosia sp. DBB001]
MDKSRNRRPTIIDVAEHAGVSKSTVARVLAGSSSISEDARDRVMKAVAATGYERNHLAVGMRSGRSGLLGIVIPDITNPFWAGVARGAQDRAAEHNISLLVFSSDWDAGKEARHLRALRQARVDGAIINPVADNFDDLSRFGLPFVFIGSSAERFSDSSSVGSDIAQAVRLGMEHLFSKGHTRPAFILGPRSRLARARFLRTVHDFCVERDIDPAVLAMEDAEYTVEGGKAAMERLLARRGRGHLSVFAANDLMALGAMMAVRDAGLSCPEDVSILGFDGIPAGAFAWPGLTTIEKPSREIGVRAVDCLLDEIAGRPEHGRVYMPCRLVERGSLADLTATAPSKMVAAGR